MDDLSEQALVAYNVYTGKLKQYGGKYNHDCGYHMKHWYAVAKLAQRLEVDVDQLICARFAGVDNGLQRSLTPAKLHKPLTVVKAHLRDYMPAQTQDYKRSFNTQQMQIEGIMKRGLPKRFKSMLDVLADPNQPYAAWFRLIYPETIDDRITKWYATDAADLYSQDSELRRFLQEDLNGRNIERITSRIL